MENSTNLEFRKIPSLKFLYEISEDGRIVRNVKSKKQLRIILDKHHSLKGYYAFWTYALIDGVRKVRRHMVHKVVAECWYGGCPVGMEVDHIDRNTYNNHYTNLRYVTHSGQMKNRKLGEHVIRQATQNCINYNKKISVSVVLTSVLDGSINEFGSLMAASKFLSDKYSTTFEHMRFKLKKRRSRIYDYDVIYRNAETERRRPYGVSNSPSSILLAP